jgi:hypothetical protein
MAPVGDMTGCDTVSPTLPRVPPPSLRRPSLPVCAVVFRSSPAFTLRGAVREVFGLRGFVR